MEIFELRYFSAVAELESIQAASGMLNVSGPALSKAVSRLEEELGVDLFYKTGRSIRLTPHGKNLKQKATEILDLERSIKSNLNGSMAEIFARIAGPQIFHGKFSLPVLIQVKEKFPLARFTFNDLSEDQAIKSVLAGEADMSITTRRYEGLKNTLLAEVEFHIYAGAKHPLKSRKELIPVKELLDFDFVQPASGLVGEVSYPSADGWREDKFSRRVAYQNVGLETLVNIVQSELAIAYLPDYLGDRYKLSRINVAGCPFVCKQKIYLNVKNEVAKWLL